MQIFQKSPNKQPTILRDVTRRKLVAIVTDVSGRTFRPIFEVKKSKELSRNVNNQRCVAYQKIEDLVYTAAESRIHAISSVLLNISTFKTCRKKGILDCCYEALKSDSFSFYFDVTLYSNKPLKHTLNTMHLTFIFNFPSAC